MPLKTIASGELQFSYQAEVTKSELRTVTSRVPQGSVLGSLLFLLYIHDLVKDLECPTLLFADDAKIYLKSYEDIEKMHMDLKRLEDGVKNGSQISMLINA